MPAVPGPLGCVLYCFRCWLIHPPPYFHLCYMTEENMCSSNCCWEAGLAHNVCHMAESYNKNLWWRHCVLWHVSTCGGTKSSERERLNNMFVRQGANCSLLVSDQVPRRIERNFYSTFNLDNRTRCNNKPLLLPKKPKPTLQTVHSTKNAHPPPKEGLSWISLFLL